MVELRQFMGQRPMRMEDDLKELGENTIGKLKKAMEQGNQELALALADYSFEEWKFLHDVYCDWAFADLAWVAKSYGEEEVPKILRHAREVLKHGQYSQWKGITLEDKVKAYAEGQRSHRSGPGEVGDIGVWEEKDRYVLELDPCGSGGRMTRGPLDGSGSRLVPPYSLGKTTRAYPWSWSKVGIPYYCVHCCVWNEIVPIEESGYPVRVTEFPVEDPSKPCHWYVYKDPRLIPEEYFERVGFKKDPAKFAAGVGFGTGTTVL